MKNKIIFTICLFIYSFIYSFSYAGQMSKRMPGLVALWHLNEGSGSVAIDSIQEDNNGIIYNCTWATCKYGNGLFFNGANYYVWCCCVPNVSYITAGAWIRMTGDGSDPDCIIAKSGPNDDQESYQIGRYINTTTINYPAILWCQTAVYTGSAITYDFTKWTHFCVTYDGINVKIYINGNIYRTDSAAYGPIKTSTNYTWLGCRGYPFASCILGYLDEVFLFNKALSATQVRQIYTMSKVKYEK